MGEDKVDHLSKIKQKLESTLDELNDSLDREKRSRADTEKARRKVEGELKVQQECVSDLQQQKDEHENTILRKEKDLTGLSVKLDEEQANVAKVQKLRKDLEEANISHEATLIGLKKKHQDAVSEMSEQIEQLSLSKSKIEKDKTSLMHEVQDVRAATDEVGRAKASAEKSGKNLIAS